MLKTNAKQRAGKVNAYGFLEEEGLWDEIHNNLMHVPIQKESQYTKTIFVHWDMYQ